MYGVDAIEMLTSKVDALAWRFDRLGTSYSKNSSGLTYEVRAICEICGI